MEWRGERGGLRELYAWIVGNSGRKEGVDWWVVVM